VNDQVEKPKSYDEVEKDQLQDRSAKNAAPDQPTAEPSGGVPSGPAKFNWVTERSGCSLPKIFRQLMSEVEVDVKTRNQQRPQNAPYAFSMTEKGPEFTVLLEAKEVHRSIVFTLAEHAIVVKDGEGNQMFDVTLTFSEEGQCRLTVHGKERELWQVRRMALEDLMFRHN
jgi:hypothetical protein